MRRLIVGVSGASGSIYAVRTLAALRATGACETHLVISPNAYRTIELETDVSRTAFEALADVVHDARDLAEPLAADGMVVVPCSMRSLSAIALARNDNLLVLSADRCLRDRIPLVLVVRETPLHLNHLRTLVEVAQAGAIVLPPIPGTHAHPRTLADVVDYTVGQILERFALSEVRVAR